MRRKITALLLVFIVCTVSGCSNDSSADYDKAIDFVIEYNHEYLPTQYTDEDITSISYWIEKETSNFLIYEDENNYYVLVQRNYSSTGYTGDVFEHSCSDGYKVGKTNERVSSTLDDRETIAQYYKDNAEPVYTVTNIELNEADQLQMRY